MNRSTLSIAAGLEMALLAVTVKWIVHQDVPVLQAVLSAAALNGLLVAAYGAIIATYRNEDVPDCSTQSQNRGEQGG